jgi:fatty acid amide hydrolase 2
MSEISAAALLSASAFELAAGIRTGALSSRAVVEAHIARTRAVNPFINAVVAERYDAALVEAAEVDRTVAAGAPLGPLAGVPCSIKEMIELEGMPSTFGARSRSGRRARGDATVVKRLRAAGAIPIGVTNVPEWGMWFETDNVVYGRTSNPHDIRRTSGGSSGGEAALVAAGGAAFGVGSDIGGSIRMPAAFCGVPAHKPSPGLIPLTGHYPVYADGPDAGLQQRSPYLVIGPLARTARDLMPLLRIMCGPDGIDPNAREPMQDTLSDPAAVDWSGRRVLLLDDPRFAMAARADAEIASAVRNAADRLREVGAVIESVPSDLFRDAVDLWSVALRSSGERPLAEVAGLAEWPVLARSLTRSLLGRPDVTTPMFMFMLGEWLGRLRFRDAGVMMQRLVALAARFDALVGADGVMLTPPHPRTAPRHGAPIWRPFDFVYTGVFNALRVPATVVPAGRASDGLPLGVQIAARRGNDHLTISAALHIEAASPPFLPADAARGIAGAPGRTVRRRGITPVEQVSPG